MMSGDKTDVEHIPQVIEDEPGMKEVFDTIPVTDQSSTRLRRKFDRRVLPLVCSLYALSYLDRGNIGNAKTAGAQDDLNLSSTQWTWVLNAFYICYTLLEWTTMFWKIFPAHIYVATLCLLWGIAAMCSGAVTNMAGLVACRCLLGIFEACFGAGTAVYLSMFYERGEMAFRIALLTGMSPLANCFASALAYGLTHIKSSIESWRLLFIVEGAPTLFFAIIVYFFLPDSPGTAKFLSEAEQTQAVERFQARDTTAKSKINWKQFMVGVLDYRNLTHAVIHFMCNYSFAGLSNFLPTIVQAMGYSSINAQGLTAPVYLASFLLCVAAAYVSDKIGRRGFIIMGFATMGGIGYLLLAVIEDMNKVGVRYLAVWLCVCGIFPALCLNIVWLLNNNSTASKRGAGTAALTTIGQCSSFLSSAVFPKADEPFYVKGCAIGCAFTFSIVLLAAALYLRLRYINKKKDEQYGVVGAHEQFDVTEEGDNHPKFRYYL